MKNLTLYVELYSIWNSVPTADMNTILDMWSTFLYNEYKIDTNRLYGWENDYIPYHMWEIDEEAEDDHQLSFAEIINTGSSKEGLPEFIDKCKKYFEEYNDVDFTKIQSKISKAA